MFAKRSVLDVWQRSEYDSKLNRPNSYFPYVAPVTKLIF